MCHLRASEAAVVWVGVGDGDGEIQPDSMWNWQHGRMKSAGFKPQVSLPVINVISNTSFSPAFVLTGQSFWFKDKKNEENYIQLERSLCTTSKQKKIL